ncbi:MAG: hypothetical protein ACI9GO_000657, partial [Bacteroidia bacterium]
RLNMRKSTILIGLALFFGSCIKDLTETADKIRNIDGIQWNPTIAAPLVYSRMKLEDLLGQVDKDQYLRVESDGSMTLVYSDKYESEAAENILRLDDQNFSETFVLTPAQVSTLNTEGEVNVLFNRDLGYNLGSGELDKLWFKNGTMDLSISSTLEHDISLSFTIKEAMKAGSTFSPTVTAAYTSLPNSASSTEGLAGLEIDFTKTAQGYSEMEVELEFTITKKGSNSIKPLETITFEVGLLNQAYSRIDGLFLDLNFSVGGDTLEIPFFDNSNGGSFTLTDPRLKFVIDNSIGIPLVARVTNFEGFSNTNNAINLTGLPNPIPIPIVTKAEIGMVKRDSFEVNKSTTNLVDYLNNKPAKNVYTIDINVGGGSGVRHSVLDISMLRVRVDVEIPLSGTARGYVIETIQPFDLSLNNAEQVEEVLLRLYTENGFPIDVEMQIYFEDSLTNIVLDSLFSSDILILPAANVDANGRVVSPNPKTTDAIMDNAGVNRLKSANRIRLRATFNTPFDGGMQPDVRFYTDYDLLLQLGVQAEVLILQKVGQ